MADSKLERRFILAIPSNPQLAFSLSTEDFFDDKNCRMAFEGLRQYWIETGKIPPEDIVHKIFDNQEAMYLALKSIVQNNDDLSEDEVRWMAAKLESSSVERQIRDVTVYSFDKYFNDGEGILGLEYFHSRLTEILINIRANQIATSSEVDLFEELDERYANLLDKETEMPISSGYRSWNKVYGGFFRGHLYTYCAPQGKGKSTMLMNFGGNAFKDGANIVIFVMEVSRNDFSYKWDSWLTGIPTKRFFMKALTKQDLLRYKLAQLINYFPVKQNYEIIEFLKKIYAHIEGSSLKELIEKCTAEGFKKRTNYFIPIDIPKGCSIEFLESKLSALVKKYSIDIAIIDYPGIMQIAEKTSSGWWNLSELYRQLKGLARFYNLGMLVGAQLHDIPVNVDTVLTPRMLRFSQAIDDHSDTVMLWNYEESENQPTGSFLMRPLKVRHFGKVDLMFMYDYSVMRITEYDYG